MDSNPITRATSLSVTTVEHALPMRLNDLARIQEQITTGLRINRPSDDASGFYQSQQLSSLENQFEQYERSITSARSWLNQTQNNLDGLIDIFAEASQEGVRAINSTLEGDEREDMAVLLEELIDNVVDLLNTQNNDEYIHAGTRSTIKPFNIDSSDPTSDSAGVVYYGNQDNVQRNIGPESSLVINVSGEDVWNVDENGDGAADFTITESIQSFIDALRANDTEAMSTSLDQIESARDHLINTNAQIGSTINRLDLSENQLVDASVVIARQKSEIQDTDFAETLVEYQRAQTSLQTTLQITGSILQTTLLNFI